MDPDVHPRCFVVALLLAALAGSGRAQLQGVPAGELVSEELSLSASWQYGWAVAVDGDLAMVTAPWSPLTASGAGGAVVFRRVDGSWVEEILLRPSVDEQNQHFGMSCVISGDTIAVGATEGVGPSGIESGTATVYQSVGGEWTEQALLEPSLLISQANFGQSLDLDGEVLVVGAPNDQFGAEQGGSAFVFERSGGTWTEVAHLMASDGAPNDRFGWTVAVSGERVLVGASGNDHSGLEDPGAAYVFERQEGEWIETDKLLPIGAQDLMRFGTVVALDGDVAVAGSPSSDAAGVDDAGRADVFRHDGTAWSLNRLLTSPAPSSDDLFASSVALEGELCAVGAPAFDVPALEFPNNGAVVLYDLGAPVSQMVLDVVSPWPPDAEVDVGRSLALADGTLLAGTPEFAGQVLVFEIAADPWSMVGGGVAGASGEEPVLEGVGTLAAGSDNAFVVWGAAPNGIVNVVIGAALLSAPFKGGTLVPTPDILVLGQQADGFGVFVLPFPWLPGVPAGTPFWTQGWLPDPGGPAGYAATDGLLGLAQ